MDALEYQRQLAEFDERIEFYKARAQEKEYEKARYVLEVLANTVSANKSNFMSGNVSTIKKE